ncbi:APC family permease [Alcaligenes sp. PF14]|uniref:APC family permease n=1 Tax=Alcaligenes sp. PF14 TaxID=3120297 RepID=UPI00301B07D4
MLNKKISVFSGISIAVSMVVGSGLFGLPGLAIKATDPITALLGWGLVIIILPSLIFVFSYLGQHHPSTEGLSLYASLGLGSWSKKGIMLLTCGTLLVGMPAFFLVGGSYIAKLAGLDIETWTIPCAILLVIVTTIINLSGLENLGWINKSVVAIVLIMATLISAQALPITIQEYLTVNSSHFNQVTLSGIWLSASIVFWAFQGWENLTFIFGEIDNPKRNIPIISWISFSIVALIYGILSLVVSAAALRGENVANLAGVAELLPDTLSGKILLVIMVLILVANANSWVFGCSRAFYAAAHAGVLPSSLKKVNIKGVPYSSLLYSMTAYISVIVFIWLSKTGEQFWFLMTTQGFIILYGLSILSFLKLSTGLLNKTIGIFSVISWFFLIHGFGYMIIYPITLFIIGTLISIFNSKKTNN